MRSAEGSVQKVGRGKWCVVVELLRDPETGKRRQRAKRVRVYPALGDVGAPRTRGDDSLMPLSMSLSLPRREISAFRVASFPISEK
jgi:hypothetical protein